MTPEIIINFVWIAWVISWIAAARWANRTVNKPPVLHELSYRIFAVIGAILLFGAFSQRRGPGVVLWRTPPALGWLMVVLAITGFGIVWWARIALGKMWSSTVTRKEDHHIVEVD